MSDYPPPSIGLTPQQKNWAMLAHVFGLSFISVPLSNIVGPLVIWKFKRHELGEFVAASAREALNFQFTVVLLLAFCFSLWWLPGVGILGLILLPVVVIGNVTLSIWATIHTGNGDLYRYPWSLRIF